MLLQDITEKGEFDLLCYEIEIGILAESIAVDQAGSPAYQVLGWQR